MGSQPCPWQALPSFGFQIAVPAGLPVYRLAHAKCCAYPPTLVLQPSIVHQCVFTCVFTCMLTCRFKEVFYTDDHLAIVMEYASEGHLSNRIKLNGRLAEDDARRHVPMQHCLDVHTLALCLQSSLLWPQATRAACYRETCYCFLVPRAQPVPEGPCVSSGECSPAMVIGQTRIDLF